MGRGLRQFRGRRLRRSEPFELAVAHDGTPVEFPRLGLGFVTESLVVTTRRPPFSAFSITISQDVESRSSVTSAQRSQPSRTVERRRPRRRPIRPEMVGPPSPAVSHSYSGLKMVFRSISASDVDVGHRLPPGEAPASGRLGYRLEAVPHQRFLPAGAHPHRRLRGLNRHQTHYLADAPPRGEQCGLLSRERIDSVPPSPPYNDGTP